MMDIKAPALAGAALLLWQATTQQIINDTIVIELRDNHCYDCQKSFVIPAPPVIPAQAGIHLETIRAKRGIPKAPKGRNVIA